MRLWLNIGTVSERNRDCATTIASSCLTARSWRAFAEITRAAIANTRKIEALHSFPDGRKK